MKTADYEWLVDGRPDGALRRAGERVSMTPAEAKYHVQMGHLRPVQAPVKSASKPVRKARKSTPEPAPKPRAKTGEPETAPDPAQDDMEAMSDE